MNTLRVISVESYKAVRSRIWLASLIVGTMAPLLMGLAMLVRHDNLLKSGSYNWRIYEQNSLIFFTVMLGTSLAGGLTGLALTDESRYNTLKSVLTSGVTRSQYLFGKLIFLWTWVIAEMAVFILIVLLVGLELGLNDPHIPYLGQMLLLETACLLALVPFFLFLALLTNNFFIVAGAGVAFAFVNLLLSFFGSGQQYIGYFPGSTSIAYILAIQNQFKNPGDVQPVAWTIVFAAFACAALVGSWVIMRRRDVQ